MTTMKTVIVRVTAVGKRRFRMIAAIMMKVRLL